MEQALTKAEAEKLFAAMLESRLKQAIEEFVETNEIRLKELSVMDRVVRVEEELKSLSERSVRVEEELKALCQLYEVRFEASEKRFESLQREMNARFEKMEERFEAVDKRFSTTQWMIGLIVGIPLNMR